MVFANLLQFDKNYLEDFGSFLIVYNLYRFEEQIEDQISLLLQYHLTDNYFLKVLYNFGGLVYTICYFCLYKN